MKRKIKIFILLLTIGATLMIYSCSKEKFSSNASAISTAHDLRVPSFSVNTYFNILQFNSVADYAYLLDTAGKTDFDDFLDDVKGAENFTSYGEYFTDPDTIIVGDFLRAVLNSDTVVQLGEYVCKISCGLQKVFVVSAAAVSEFTSGYSDLISNNTENTGVVEYDFDDNIIEQLLDAEGSDEKLTGSNPTTQWCSESGIGGRDISSNTVSLGSAGSMQIKSHFNRYGIYYTLFAENKCGTGSLGTLFIDLEPKQYHARCGVTVGPQNIYNYNNNTTQSVVRYQSYQGSKNLNYVHFTVKGKYQYINLTYTYETNWIEIRVNI